MSRACPPKQCSALVRAERGERRGGTSRSMSREVSPSILRTNKRLPSSPHYNWRTACERPWGSHERCRPAGVGERQRILAQGVASRQLLPDRHPAKSRRGSKSTVCVLQSRKGTHPAQASPCLRNSHRASIKNGRKFARRRGQPLGKQRFIAQLICT